jgi:hypothetical protein
VVFDPLGPLNKEKMILPHFEKKRYKNRRFFHLGIIDAQYAAFIQGIPQKLNHNFNTSTADR